MFFRKYWIPLSVFIVAVVGVGLYVLQTRPPKEPILIIKPVEFEKQPAKAPVVEQPEQVGHVHEDRTRHEGAQAPVAVTQAPQTETPQPQEALFSKEEDARSTANLLDHLETYLPLAEEKRELLKQLYEEELRHLKSVEERNAQRERNFSDTSRIKERVAKAKADLDAQERDIANLKKWRDEHANK